MLFVLSKCQKSTTCLLHVFLLCMLNHKTTKRVYTRTRFFLFLLLLRNGSNNQIAMHEMYYLYKCILHISLCMLLIRMHVQFVHFSLPRTKKRNTIFCKFQQLAFEPVYSTFITREMLKAQEFLPNYFNIYSQQIIGYMKIIQFSLIYSYYCWFISELFL